MCHEFLFLIALENKFTEITNNDNIFYRVLKNKNTSGFLRYIFVSY